METVQLEICPVQSSDEKNALLSSLSHGVEIPNQASFMNIRQE